jgi:hypothetical protein
MPMVTKLFKYLLYFFISIIILASSVAGLALLFKDSIIQIFVNEADKRLGTKVVVDKIDIEFFKTFPYFSLDFKNIRIAEAIKGSNKNFAEAENLYVSLSFIDLLERRYKIKKLYIRNGSFNFKIFKDGTDNFSIFKASEDTTSQLIVFDLSDIKIEKVGLKYEDVVAQNNYDVFFNSATARFHFNDDNWDISLKSDLVSNEIKLNNLSFFKNKPAIVESSIIYSQRTKAYKILPSEVAILNANFKLEGELSYGDRAYVDIKFSEHNSDFQTIISFLPNKIATSLTKYRSKGDVYFNGIIKGFFNRGNKPLLKVEFGCKNASFYHPDANAGITNASFTGEYNNGEGKDKTTSLFYLRNVKASLDKHLVEGNLNITNLDDPLVEFDLKTLLDAANLLRLFPNENIEKADGDLSIDIKFEAKTHDIKHKNYSKINSEGRITFNNLNLKVRTNPLELRGCTGAFDFTKSDLVAKEFYCSIGHSDFEFNGSLKNIIPYLLYKNEPLTISAFFHSDYLDLDELLKSNQNVDQDKSKADYRLSFSNQLAFDLDCDIKKLKFKRFRPKDIKGKISLHLGEFIANGCQMNIANGILKVDANVLQLRDSSFATTATFKVDKIEIDSIFYATENFGQTFITHHNLKGTLTSEVKTTFNFSKNLEINTSSLVANVDMLIKNGHLVNFAPMKSLSKFVNEEAMENIKFSELKNSFLISNRTIFIPEMVLKSSITTMNVMGTHTFDNRFEYHIKLPLKNYKKKHNEGEEEAIEGNIFKGFYLYLTIKGTPDNYKVSYDKSAVKEKIKERLDTEKKEFIDIFKKDYANKKQEKQKDLELSEEEMNLN